MFVMTSSVQTKERPFVQGRVQSARLAKQGVVRALSRTESLSCGKDELGRKVKEYQRIQQIVSPKTRKDVCVNIALIDLCKYNVDM